MDLANSVAAAFTAALSPAPNLFVELIKSYCGMGPITASLTESVAKVAEVDVTATTPSDVASPASAQGDPDVVKMAPVKMAPVKMGQAKMAAIQNLQFQRLLRVINFRRSKTKNQNREKKHI